MAPESPWARGRLTYWRIAPTCPSFARSTGPWRNTQRSKRAFSCCWTSWSTRSSSARALSSARRCTGREQARSSPRARTTTPHTARSASRSSCGQA
eukprot:1476327-Alexandrium_andersonii.AAC.1